MSAEERRLFEAIARNPKDDAPRLVYSDWLKRNGQPEWAEFIRVQCELAWSENDLPAMKLHRLRNRENELRTAHQDEWLGNLIDFADQCRWTFRRGWVAELQVTLTPELAEVITTAPELRLLENLEINRIDPPQEARRVFAQLGKTGTVLSNLRRLLIGVPEETSHRPLPYQELQGLGLPKFLRRVHQLEELWLLDYEFEWETIFELKSFWKLRQLHIVAPYRNELPVKSLAENPALYNLEELHIACKDAAVLGAFGYVSADDFRALVHSFQLRNLRDLTLHHANIGINGCEELVRSHLLNQLEYLNLCTCCWIDDDCLQVLASSPATKRLKELSISRSDGCSGDPEAPHYTSKGVQFLRRKGVPVYASSMPLTETCEEQPGRTEDWFSLGEGR